MQCYSSRIYIYVHFYSIHPTLPLLATVSGQRHFPNIKISTSGTESTDAECEEDEIMFENTWKGENVIKLWWYQQLA